jgi:hypothetical protein
VNGKGFKVTLVTPLLVLGVVSTASACSTPPNPTVVMHQKECNHIGLLFAEAQRLNHEQLKLFLACLKWGRTEGWAPTYGEVRAGKYNDPTQWYNALWYPEEYSSCAEGIRPTPSSGCDWRRAQQ